MLTFSVLRKDSNMVFM